MADYALLVGVGHFKNDLESLAFIEEDIASMRQVMIEVFSLPDSSIYALTENDASSENIASVITTIKEQLSPGDRIILYFSTHGKSVYNSPYIASYDAVNLRKDSVTGWLSTQWLLGTFHEQGANVIAFLDCCQSTSFFSPRGIQANELQENAINASQVQNKENLYTVVLAAAGESEEAHPDPERRHGCWTYYLTLALCGNAPEALWGKSNRITINSLQEYLKSTVPSRIYDLYGKTQTPYLWGTYSDDITIIELSSMEGSQMRIRDIYFGEIDADSEKKSAPDSAYLENNFYDLNGIATKLDAKNSIEVIIGGKGTGKTYIGEYLEAHRQNIIYQTVGAISLSDINTITLTQSDEKGKYIDAWKYTIYTLLACSIVKRERPGHEEFSTLLHQIYGPHTDILLENPVGRRRLMFNKTLKNSLRLHSEYSTYATGNGTTPLGNLAMLYEDRLNAYYADEPLYFLIDGLDEQLRGSLRDDQKVFLLDLLSMVEESNSILHQVRIVLLFRNDILKMVTGEANLNKTFSARTCLLSWLPSGGNFEDSPLYQLVERRIQTAAQVNNYTDYCGLSQIMPARIKGTPTWEWIMDLTRYTPRDVVAFFNKCKDFCDAQTAFTDAIMWDALRPYSDYLWQEFQDILSGTSLASMSEPLLALFNDISNKHNVSSAGTIIPYAEFLSSYRKITELNHISVDRALKTLYESGLICIRTNAGRTYWYFRENPIEYDQVSPDECSFEIHKGLWKKAHIW